MPILRSTAVLDWIVLKVTQICNLNCTYCYVYNRGDTSWKERPRHITDDVIEKLCDRIIEHCNKHSLDYFTIEFHGGEPLALGKARFESLFRILNSRLQNISVKYLLQTNGLLLDDEWANWLYDNNIRFGISIDGPPSIADSRRLSLAGVGTTERLMKNILHLRSSSPRFRDHNPACLCVVHPESNGAEIVNWFFDNGFRAVDFLLPDGTYSNLPDDWKGPEPYINFMISAFDTWLNLRLPGLTIRKFETMLLSMMGVPHGLDSLGGDLKRLCVVETDGGVALSDVARMCGGAFSKDRLNIFTHPLGSHSMHYDLDAIQAPCNTCKECKHFASCGGGYLPHRYDGTSFNNPSLYCDVLFALSEHMQSVLDKELPSLATTPNLEQVTVPPSVLESGI